MKRILIVVVVAALVVAAMATTVGAACGTNSLPCIDPTVASGGGGN